MKYTLIVTALLFTGCATRAVRVAAPASPVPVSIPPGHHSRQWLKGFIVAESTQYAKIMYDLTTYVNIHPEDSIWKSCIQSLANAGHRNDQLQHQNGN